MRWAVVFVLGVTGCGLALNGTDTGDAGAGGKTPTTGAHVDASAGDPPGGDAGPAPGLDASSAVDANGAPDANGGSDANGAIDSAPPSTTTSFDVPATDGPSCTSWFDTGLDVPDGAEVTITANGTWNYGLGPVFACGPEGNAMGGGPGSTTPVGELVGQIGGGDVIDVGASRKTTAANGGRLAFGINDAFCDDNSGAVHVVVTIAP